MFGRGQVKTHGEVMRTELNEGLDHLRQAAAHGASAVGAGVAPRWENARVMVAVPTDKVRDYATSSWQSTMANLGPLLEAARVGAMEASKAREQAAKQSTTSDTYAKTPGIRRMGGDKATNM